MGYDIELVKNYKHRGEITVHSDYLSWNWNDKVFKHFKIHDIVGHCGRKGVIRYLELSLQKMADDGYSTDIEIEVDGWGTPNVDMSNVRIAFHRQCRLMAHVERFLERARTYPDAYWFIDNGYWGTKLYEYEPCSQYNLPLTDSEYEPCSQYNLPLNDSEDEVSSVDEYC